LRRVLIGGLLGALVMIIWLVVADGFLGFRRNIEMSQLPNERTVYAFLSEHVTEPGRYVCNPEVLPNQRFPGDDPIFAVHYSGLGHDDAGQEIILGLVIALLASLAGSWLLANASSRVLSRYGSRVLFFAVVGIVAALLGTMARFGISAYSLGDAVALGIHDLAAWVLAGLVVAWKVSPARERVETRAR